MKTFFKALLGFLLSLVGLAVVIVIAINVFLDNSLSKRQIFRLVEKHSETILEDIKENNFEDTLAIDGVTGVDSDDLIDINCGGSGIGSQTSCSGFYYNEDDKPVVVYYGSIYHVDESELIAYDKGYSYTEMHSDGTVSDNTYYTEIILDGFYYYEWHW